MGLRIEELNRGKIETLFLVYDRARDEWGLEWVGDSGGLEQACIGTEEETRRVGANARVD